MGLFSSDNGKGGSSAKGEIKGSCGAENCGTKVSGRNGKEAGSAAMKHGGDKHGNPHQGFRWGK